VRLCKTFKIKARELRFVRRTPGTPQQRGAPHNAEMVANPKQIKLLKR
jgi:hypothetical protein